LVVNFEVNQNKKRSSTVHRVELLVIKKQKPYNGKITRQPAGPKHIACQSIEKFSLSALTSVLKYLRSVIRATVSKY
jgi:hypothetical protein